MNTITLNGEECYSFWSSKIISKLPDSGLKICYKDYYTTKSSLYAKTASPTFNYSNNANSLEDICCTVNTEKPNT